MTLRSRVQRMEYFFDTDRHIEELKRRVNTLEQEINAIKDYLKITVSTRVAVATKKDSKDA